MLKYLLSSRQFEFEEANVCLKCAIDSIIGLCLVMLWKNSFRKMGSHEIKEY